MWLVASPQTRVQLTMLADGSCADRAGHQQFLQAWVETLLANLSQVAQIGTDQVKAAADYFRETES